MIQNRKKTEENSKVSYLQRCKRMSTKIEAAPATATTTAAATTATTTAAATTATPATTTAAAILSFSSSTLISVILRCLEDILVRCRD